MPALNFPDMLMMSGEPLSIAGQTGRVRARLPSQVINHHRRYGSWIRQKRTQEAHRAQLQGITQSVVVAPPDADFLVIRVVQVEVPSQLDGRWVSIKATVAARLLIGQEVYGHDGSSPLPF